MKTRTDNRSLQQVAKSVAAMRRRVAAAVRKHTKLQERIKKLSEQGRIISLYHDSEVVVGINCWYLKSDSLNVDADSPTNWYYETTYNEQAGYGCSCERLNGDCKHTRRLGATFAPVAQPVVAAPAKREEEKRELVTAGTLNNANQGFSLLRR